MYKIGICDDNIAVCSEIEQCLLAYSKAESIKLEVEVFLSGVDLYKALKNEKSLFQLLFLDIELGDTDGIAIGKFLREELHNEMTQIAFISYSQEYAFQLFGIRPIDFLIKPVDYKKIYAVMKVYERLFPDKKLFFEFQKNRKICQVAQSEIICIKCEGKKIRLVTSQEEIEFYGKMADAEKQLNSVKFWTIHKSYIINVDYVFSFGKDEIKMINGERLPVSKAYKKEMAERLLTRRKSR